MLDIAASRPAAWRCRSSRCRWPTPCRRWSTWCGPLAARRGIELPSTPDGPAAARAGRPPAAQAGAAQPALQRGQVQPRRAAASRLACEAAPDDGCGSRSPTPAPGIAARQAGPAVRAVRAAGRRADRRRGHRAWGWRCRGAWSRHGRHARVDSALGHGQHVLGRAARRPSPPAAAAGARRAEQAGRADAAGDGTVLYVEDNLANLRLVEQSSAPAGHPPADRHARRRSASTWPASTRPTWSCWTSTCPTSTGEEVLSRLRGRRDRGIPVVVLSADATPDRSAARLRPPAPPTT